MTRSIRQKATYAGLGLTAAGGLLALSLAGPGIAIADPTPTASGSASAPATGGRPDREAQRAQRQEELAEALAKELGVDKEKVPAALEKVRAERETKARADRVAALKTRLDAAVAEGKLTREQADAILKAAEAGVDPGGTFSLRGGARWPPPPCGRRPGLPGAPRAPSRR